MVMGGDCRLSPERVAVAYAGKRTGDFKTVVASWGLGDVVVYDPDDDPDTTALASVDADVEVSCPISGTKRRANTRFILGYDRKGFELPEAELIRVSCDLLEKTEFPVPPGGFSLFKRAVARGIQGWLDTIKTVMAGKLEKRVAELYPEEGSPEVKLVVDNTFKKELFSVGLKEAGFDPEWAKSHFVGKGHKLDARAEKYVEARVAVAREAAGW